MLDKWPSEKFFVVPQKYSHFGTFSHVYSQHIKASGDINGDFVRQESGFLVKRGINRLNKLLDEVQLFTTKMTMSIISSH